jgi:hypothetical protein
MCINVSQLTVEELKALQAEVAEELELRETVGRVMEGDIVGFLLSGFCGRGVVVTAEDGRFFVQPTTNRRGWAEQWGEGLLLSREHIVSVL